MSLGPMIFRAWCVPVVIGLSAALTAAAWGVTVIGFDDRPGQPGPFPGGAPVLPEFLINDHYAALGVLFDSAGGGIAINAPSNPASPPNTASATGPGPVLSYSDPVIATFQIGDIPAVVDSVAITLTSSSSLSSMQVFDIDGVLLGEINGGASATLSQTFPGQIHSVRILQGPMAFDDFTFDGLAEIPEPNATGFCLAAAACWLIRRHGNSR